MDGFDAHWRAALSFRRASRELEGLLSAVYTAFSTPAALPHALEGVLLFLSSGPGRTDANCSVTDHFIRATETEWSALDAPLRTILDDMSGTLHDAIYAPNIARTFESTPEQLLERVRALR